MPKDLLRRALFPLTAVALSATLVPGIAAADQGVDVASWQHPGNQGINWFAVGNSGKKFAMIKATEGTTYINPYFVQDFVGAHAAGIAVGTYHYADVTGSPEAQAAEYSAVVLGQNGPMDLPPVIDFEDARGQSTQHMIDWLHRYLNTVERLTGRTPIIYTYPSFWRNEMGNTTEFTQYPLWIADYNGGDGPTYPLPGGWNDWAFWQYTSQGQVPGITGNVDLNVHNDTAGAFDQLLGRSSVDPFASLESLGPALQSLSESAGSLGQSVQSLNESVQSLGSALAPPPGS